MTTNEVTIRSAGESPGLRLFNAHHSGKGDYFSIEVGDPTVRVELEVYAYAPTDAHDLARFFREMAREWRGWADQKVWESLEGELRFEASADGKGHVTLRTLLRPHHGRWRFQGEALIEAGALDQLAADVGEFIGKLAHEPLRPTSDAGASS